MASSDDDGLVGAILGGFVGLGTGFLLATIVWTNAVPQVKCDLGDNVTLAIDVDEDDEFTLPESTPAESIETCTIHKTTDK